MERRKKLDDKIYHESMQITSQVKFCPNAFRIDLYRGCDFGCRYCFANMEAFNEVGTGLSKWREAQIEDIRKKFRLAFDTDKPSKSVVIELLRNRVPLHCGGMSDPFQSREWDLHLTYELIKLSNEYNYPICFSTKTDRLPDEYYEILNPDIHAFQVSLMGYSDEYIKKWESNTPSAVQRIDFIKHLRSKGFWCGVRIQPVIDVLECEQLINELQSLPSYYSIEHLHIIYDSHTALNTLKTIGDNLDEFCNVDSVLEVKPFIKKQNLLRLTELANSYGVKVGAADNDLHYMSQSRCCCGIDTINSNFDNYLKFNTTYFSTGETDFDNIFIPKSNCRRHFNIGKGKPEVYIDTLVKSYIKNNPNLIPDKYRETVEKKLFGKIQKKLI